MSRLTAIVSGGQTGADRGGLDAAIALGLGHGGWAPKNWRAEDGQVPAIYRANMRQSSSPDYGLRTRLNVQDSDGTLVFSFAEELTGGSAFTARSAAAQKKPCMHLALPARGRTRITDAVRVALLEWVRARSISVLNVAGPLESKEPGIQQAVCDALVWIFEDEIAEPGVMPTASDVVAAVCEHGASHAGEVLFSEFPEARARFEASQRGNK